MTKPTPRDAAPGDVQRLQAINEVLYGTDDLGELPVDDALARLDEAHRVLVDALNPGAGQMEEPGSGMNR